MSNGWRRACVVGSGVAGLMAARVLADHFNEVIVFERDPRPDGQETRAGAAQGDHVHAVLRRGQMTIEALFPGLAEELTALGAINTSDAGADVRPYRFGRWAASCKVGFGMLQLTRALLEYGLRRRVEQLPNVSFRYGADIAGLMITFAEARVAGVRLRAHDGVDEEAIFADLVIDASGRGAASLDWLKTHDFPAPREDIIVLDFGCASALFEIPPGFQADWSFLLIGPDTPDSRVAFLQVVEGGRWLVSLGGRGMQRPEAGEAGFRDFARSLPTTIIHDLISRARMLGPVKRLRFASSLYRRFDLLEAHPEGFLALGDAVCSLNPVHGQGMSISAVGVEVLAACLAGRGGGTLEGLWREFYARNAAVISVPWKQCLASDMLYDATRFARPRGFAFRRPALVWAEKLSLRDPSLRAALSRTANLVAEPGDRISFFTLAKAQARVWLTLARTGAAPDYRFKPTLLTGSFGSLKLVFPPPIATRSAAPPAVLGRVHKPDGELPPVSAVSLARALRWR